MNGTEILFLIWVILTTVILCLSVWSLVLSLINKNNIATLSTFVGSTAPSTPSTSTSATPKAEE